MTQGNADPNPWGDKYDNGSYFGFGTDGPLPGYFMESQYVACRRLPYQDCHMLS